MKAQLIRYNNEQYLFLGSGVAKTLSTAETRAFLRNYADGRYYNNETANSSSALRIEGQELLAVVEDNGELRICDADLIKDVFGTDYFPYLTTEEFAEKHNRKQSIVLRLCRDGRIEGAIQKHSVWLIPENAPYPADARVGIRVPSSRTGSMAPYRSKRANLVSLVDDDGDLVAMVQEDLVPDVLNEDEE